MGPREAESKGDSRSRWGTWGDVDQRIQSCHSVG